MSRNKKGIYIIIDIGYVTDKAFKNKNGLHQKGK